MLQNSVLFEAFAWQAVQIELEGGTDWINDWSSDEFAHKADVALCPPGWTGENRFNSTKRSPWRRWIEFLGLQANLLGIHRYPYVVSRLSRQMLRGRLPIQVEIPAAEFMAAIASELPYLDSGSLFLEYADRMRFKMEPKTVSRLLSTALRDLQDDGKISLIVRGDSSDNYQLAPDPFSKLRSFSAVMIKSEVAQ